MAFSPSHSLFIAVDTADRNKVP